MKINVNGFWWAAARAGSLTYHAVRQGKAPHEVPQALCNVVLVSVTYHLTRTDLKKIPADARGCRKCLRMIERGAD